MHKIHRAEGLHRAILGALGDARDTLKLGVFVSRRFHIGGTYLLIFIDNIWGRIQIIRIIPLIIWWNNQVFTNKISWIVGKPLTILVLIYLFMHIIHIYIYSPDIANYLPVQGCQGWPSHNRKNTEHPLVPTSLAPPADVHPVFIMMFGMFETSICINHWPKYWHHSDEIHPWYFIPQFWDPKLWMDKKNSTFHQGFVWRVLSILDMIGGTILGSSPQSNLKTWC